MYDAEMTYLSLPALLSSRAQAAALAQPVLVAFNDVLANDLGMVLSPAERLQRFSGQAHTNEGAGLALAYAGHQFANFVPLLGDGRALLIGQSKDSTGRVHDIQLKGSGRTPYSRRGDGRSALGPALREYLVSEAMHALGVPATRSLAVVLSGEKVQRETLLPGGIVTRVAESHVRVGTFELLAAHEDKAGLRALVAYVRARHGLGGEAAGTREVLAEIAKRQAYLISRWMLVGFVHGVMNTDNVAISGQTLDFGPCAFLDTYDPRTVKSFIDQQGRYAYQNQPGIAQWNLARLCEALWPLLEEECDDAEAAARAILEGFAKDYTEAFSSGLAHKLGFAEASAETRRLADAFLALLLLQRADFTNSFAALALAKGGRDLGLGEDGERWFAQWQQAHSAVGSQGVAARCAASNPIVIPRNHLVERAVKAAEQRLDFAPFHELLAAVTRPFTASSERMMSPPQEDEVVRHTYCGT